MKRKEDGKGATENMRFVDQNYAMRDWMRREQEKAQERQVATDDLGSKDSETKLGTPKRKLSNTEPLGPLCVSTIMGIATGVCICMIYAWDPNPAPSTPTIQSSSASVVRPITKPTTPATVKSRDRFSITVYTESWCGSCERLKAELLQRDLPFIELPTSDPSYVRGVHAMSGRTVVPITRVGKIRHHELRETWIIGNNPDAIENAALVGASEEVAASR